MAVSTAPTVTPLGDTLLDESALYFVSFDGLVNNCSYQTSGILTYEGFQYTGWYHADRTATLARRRLPDGPWEIVRLPHTLSTNDSHNVIALGVSPQDGRLHVAMDTHNTPVYYVKSEAGLVSDVASRSWTLDRFGEVQRTFDGVDLGGITYPRFVVTPEQRLQLSYRTPSSGNGTKALAEYDDGVWRDLGEWSSKTGAYTHNGVTSTTRSMYVHGMHYGPDGRLHASFTWREGNFGILCSPKGLTNHDTGYVYSDDRGRTWCNDAGEVVGETGGRLVSIDSPGLVVDPIDADCAVMNQESQAIDAEGRPHVVVSYVPSGGVSVYADDRRERGRTFHLWRSGPGRWNKTELPVSPQATGRSRIVFDRSGDVYVVMPYGRIVSAGKATNWTDWTLVFDAQGLDVFGEVVVDEARVKSENVLSVLYQQASSGTSPSPIRVIDFRLNM